MNSGKYVKLEQLNEIFKLQPRTTEMVEAYAVIQELPVLDLDEKVKKIKENICKETDRHNISGVGHGMQRALNIILED